jgi:hypothetical protein
MMAGGAGTSAERFWIARLRRAAAGPTLGFQRDCHRLPLWPAGIDLAPDVFSDCFLAG